MTGSGITKHIGMLEAFGLDRAYQCAHISGDAMGGQYIHLNVPDHLSEIVVKDFHITWDPAHRIELSIKDTNPHL